MVFIMKDVDHSPAAAFTSPTPANPDPANTTCALMISPQSGFAATIVTIASRSWAVKVLSASLR